MPGSSRCTPSLTNRQRKGAHYPVPSGESVVGQQAQIARVQQTANAEALLRNLDGLRSVITIFGPDHRLLFVNAHINYLFRSFPPYLTLIGKSYEEMIRLEIDGGEISPAMLTSGYGPFIAQRMTQLREKSWAPRDISLSDRRVVELKARKSEDG